MLQSMYIYHYPHCCPVGYYMYPDPSRNQSLLHHRHFLQLSDMLYLHLLPLKQLSRYFQNHTLNSPLHRQLQPQVYIHRLRQIHFLPLPLHELLPFCPLYQSYPHKYSYLLFLSCYKAEASDKPVPLYINTHHIQDLSAAR